jgi:quinol monooxygenase YgiN
MIVAILEFPVKSGERDAAVAALRVGLVATRAFEGNLACELLLDDDPSHFVLYELWRSSADHDAYQAWRATPDGTIAGFASHLAGPFSAAQYAVVDH